MIPKINNKSFLECSEEDLNVLIENEDFRENEFIDYKQNFAFLELPKGTERNNKISEFRSDVCSFANADSGYLIFGINDNNGCASEIIGIDIPNGNTDKFELDRRNNLSPILPRTPYLKFHFIKLNNGKFVVIIFVKHDSLTPYIHLENECNYKIYKRMGNGKRVIGYQELKNMFNQSLSLEKEILNYRKDRINYYLSLEDNEDRRFSQFMLLHFIPETFLDSSYKQNMFVLERTKDISFRSIFSEFDCATSSIPCVDGLKFVSSSTYKKGNTGYLNNNGIVECFYPLCDVINGVNSKYPNGFIAWEYLWYRIRGTYCKYVNIAKDLFHNQKIYICISVIGCKDVVSESIDFDFYAKKIDRDAVLCEPIIAENIETENENALLLNKLYLEFLLSLGVKSDRSIDDTIQELYHG